METAGDDRDCVPAAMSTIADGQETTFDDGPNDAKPVVSMGSTGSATNPDRGGPPSTIDALPDGPEGTADFTVVPGRDTADSTFGEPRETWSLTVENLLGPARPPLPAPGTLPGEFVPGFEILSMLGSGGMGIVFKARQLRLNRLVALKMIRRDKYANEQNRARFEIEAEAVARLSHPNILRIYQIGKVNDVPYFALELLEGGQLSERLANSLQPVREAAALLATLARAVHAAHLAGIVHRDLKPSNVLFDLENVPKIADFGLAKRLEVEEGDTQTGQIIGTACYMAPEQAKGLVHEIGPAADIYSLGAIFYEMLTGRPPLKGTSSAETVVLVLNEDPLPPSRLRPKIPFDLETICLKCLAKDPLKRYCDALSLAEDLDRYLAGQPIRARRTPLWERGLKLARRRPATALLLVLGILATGAAVAAVLLAQASARDAARRDDQRFAMLSETADTNLFEGQRALAEKRWEDARLAISQVLTHIESEPRLAAVRAKAESLLEQARRGLEADTAAEQARTQLDGFRAAHDEALFFDTRFAGFEPANQLEATCRAARAGLAAFGRTAAGDVGALPPLPDSLTPAEREEVRSGFYELYLILADAVSQAPAAEPGQRAEKALRIIDQAASLRSPPTRAFHLRRAAYLEMKGDPVAAGRARAEAERLAPADAFDFFLIGRELSKRSDWAAAIPYFGAAIHQQDHHFWAQCLLAICYLQTNQPSMARSSLNACLQLKPDFAWLYLLRGLACARVGNVARDMAKRLPDQAISMTANASEQFQAAEADYRKALGLIGNRAEDAELRYVLRVNRGVIRLERQDLAAAAVDLQEAIRLNGRRFDAFSALGQVYQRQGRTNEALEQFGRAIELRPNWAPLYRGRADIFLALKNRSPDQTKAALRDLADAIRCESPGNPLIAADRTRQAALLQEARRTNEALEACDAALAIVPRYAPAHRLRIRLLLEMKRYDDLVRSCDVALDSSKPSAELYELRGMAKDALEDFAGAIADYTMSLSLRAQNPDVLRRRGWSYLANDATRPAVSDFDEALRLAPSNADAYSGRGCARARLGHHRDAVSDAEQSLRHGGSSWRIAYNAARIYAQAASGAAWEARKTGPDAVLLVSQYRDRAVALVRLALDRLPAERRATLFRETILADPALEPIRRRLKSLGTADAD